MKIAERNDMPKALYIRLDPKLIAKLKHAAIDKGCTVQHFVTELIKAAL